MTTTVKLDLTQSNNGRVILNGLDVSTAIAGVTVNAQVGEMTSVLLRLPAAAVTMDGVAKVKLAPQIREILVAAGWTPPQEGGLLVMFPNDISVEEIERFRQEFAKRVGRTSLREAIEALHRELALDEDGSRWKVGGEIQRAEVIDRLAAALKLEEVQDDGDPDRDTGAGLRLMRERGMLP